MSTQSVTEVKRIATSDIPQANQLAKVRQLVELCQAGRVTPRELQASLGLDGRHVSYYRRAATILQLVSDASDGRIMPTPQGTQLLETDKASERERAALLGAVRGAAALRPFWSYLEGSEALAPPALARRIEEETGLGHATALRRAHCLEQWRAYLTTTGSPLAATSSVAEMPSRPAAVLQRAMHVLRHAVEHYNSFTCPVRELVVLQHADHALELLVKSKLAVSGRPDALTSDEYDIFHCLNVLTEMPQFRGRVLRTPLLVLLHRQRNLVQHAGEAVPDDLLTLLLAQGVKAFLEWAQLFFGLGVHDVFPQRTHLALPNFDIDLSATQRRHIDLLKSAAKRREKIPSEVLRSMVLFGAALDPQLSDEEKDRLFAEGTPLTARGGEVADRLRRVVDGGRAPEYAQLAEFLASSPTLTVVSRTSGAKTGALPVYFDPKNPNSLPLMSPAAELLIGDARSTLQVGVAQWRTARLEGRFDFLSLHSLIRLYRQRDNPSLLSLTSEEVEAVTLSSMKYGLPFWAWLARMEHGRIVQWAKDALAKTGEFDLLRPLGSVVVLGAGQHFRYALEVHLRDRRPTVRTLFGDLLNLYDSPSKLERIRADNLLRHPNELATLAATDQDPRLDVLVETATGQQELLRNVLSRGDQGLSELHAVFAHQPATTSMAILKWMGMARSPVAVNFALEHIHDRQSKYACKQLLRRFDLVAYCPFLG